MERRETEDFRWPFMANPTLQNRQVSSPNHRFQINGSHVSTNPNFYQNNDLFQNPGSSYQTLPQTSRSVHEYLEDSFSRMNLNVSSNNDSSPLNFRNLPSQKMRVESAVRGLMGLNHESFGGHSNSTRSLGSQNIVGGAMTRSANFPSTPMANDFGFNLQRRSQSFEGLDYACSRRLINNSDLQSCWGNTWAVNGLESEKSASNLLSSMYNHPGVYPQQRSKYPSLEDLKGHVSSVAKDQNGCRFLQKKFDHETIRREEIEIIFLEVKDNLHELMVHQFANYLIQKLFEAGNQEHRTRLLHFLVHSEQRFLKVCTDVHGTRAVQKFMERISTQEQRSILLSVLKPIAVTLTNDIHGHHIIEQCFNKFSNEDTKLLVDEIVEHCLDIATDKSGCCVLQQCLDHAKAEARKRLLAEITANAFVLSEHPYGNYVVQYVLGMRVPHVTSNIIVHLGGSYVTLSMNKYGSNVVEKCLKDAGEGHSARIITEIMHDPDFLKVLQDPYGNYVVQSALHVSKGDLHNTLVEFIQRHYPFLHSHLFGKKVLARTKWRKNRLRLYHNVVTCQDISRFGINNNHMGEHQVSLKESTVIFYPGMGSMCIYHMEPTKNELSLIDLHNLFSLKFFERETFVGKDEHKMLTGKPDIIIFSKFIRAP
ncbi:putative pumilio homolog 8, chloroplastic [Durio zibethinus]|uniref:Pumilio homolog 8, chloroplastic n=1 Tax=Durio zibethinus TaxID=66656 RepID=A0A6P5XBS2_DURZI|nr:putative pumilio homolog 8, chloroplastic [Durio zibethinus]